MANKIFRQVLCSERLPEKKGYYYTDNGHLYFLLDKDCFSDFCSFWLEEVELPSEDEIEVIIDNLLIERGEHFSRVRNPLYGEERILAHNTFTKAIELIKGEGLNNG